MFSQICFIYTKMVNKYYQKQKERYQKESRERYQNIKILKTEKGKRQKKGSRKISKFYWRRKWKMVSILSGTQQKVPEYKMNHNLTDKSNFSCFEDHKAMKFISWISPGNMKKFWNSFTINLLLLLLSLLLLLLLLFLFIRTCHFSGSIYSFKLNSSINVLNKYLLQIKQLFCYWFDNVVLAFLNFICHLKCILLFMEIQTWWMTNKMNIK